MAAETKILAKTIPSAYVRLDDTVTDPDAFLSVRDLQTARLNHNMLLSRRVRRVIMSHNYATLARTFRTGRSSSPFSGDLLFMCPITLSPLVKQLRLVVRAAFFTGSGANVLLYPVVATPGCNRLVAEAYSSAS